MGPKISQNDTQTHTYCQFSEPQIRVLKAFLNIFRGHFVTEFQEEDMSENLNSDRGWHRIKRINIKKCSGIQKIQINVKVCFDIADSNQSQVLRGIEDASHGREIVSKNL